MGRKSRRDVELERGERGTEREWRWRWDGEKLAQLPPPPSPNPQPATQDSPPPKTQRLSPRHQGGERLCRLDINIQCAVKAGDYSKHTAHEILVVSRRSTNTQHIHSCCGLSWAKEGSRGVLNLTNLYETNTIRAHTQTHTLAHTLSPRL